MNMIEVSKAYPLDWTLHGTGNGLWGFPAGLDLNCNKAMVRFTLCEDCVFGSLQITTDVSSSSGLPYTDPGVLDDTREELLRHDELSKVVSVEEVYWSEQGRQDTFLIDFDATMLNTMTLPKLKELGFVIKIYDDEYDTLVNLFSEERWII